MGVEGGGGVAELISNFSTFFLSILFCYALWRSRGTVQMISDKQIDGHIIYFTFFNFLIQDFETSITRFLRLLLSFFKAFQKN